ncbi:PQQ-binding-like beta-propeller repeat protein [Actinomadura decatromicini]|uniref:PQQ-binding-like beta-propeller repeat protein n=1 Tax=Actinomadura decatromicini TaxID=2604572 RepID=A0A5D3FPD1_9ACTN|nr:PQQ-binding-like beta-propeller repeat protein [Actinomadura decatromicini]TYK49530.1 PQQ-binding-like beta-propeller repeat protein [Actinomadura decatromicini]
MLGRRHGRMTRVALAAVLLLSAALVCAADSGPREAADRSWAGRALPNLMTPVWTATVANLDVGLDAWDFIGRPEASFSPDAAVLPDLTGVQVRDPRTGRMLHDIPVGEKVGDVALAGGVVVAQTRANSARNFDFRQLRAYDLSSGRELWVQDMYSSHVVETGRYSFLGATAVTSRGVVFTAVTGEMIGLDPRTGRTRWTRSSACSNGTLSATENMVVVVCEKGPLLMVDPENGRLYSTEIPGSVVDVATTPDAVGVEWTSADPTAPNPPRPLPRTTTVVSGPRLVIDRVDGSPGHLVQVMGRQAILAGDGELRAVSLARGAELWRRKTEVTIAPGGRSVGSEDGVSAADGLVLVNGANEETQPGTTSLIDASGRTTPPIAWPVSGQFAGAIPGYVLLVSHTAQQHRFTALRLDRETLPDPRLGGARPSDWPDPCRLLTPARLAALGRYTGFPAKPSPFAERTRLPYSDRCDFAGRHPFSLRVAWVAPDRAAAETLTQSLLPGPPGVWQAGPGGYQYRGMTASAPPVADRALVARGRFVIAVFAPAQVGLTERIARLLQADRPPGPADAFDRAAVEKAVHDRGFAPLIQMSPPNPGPLRAVYADCGPPACGQVFLFEGDRLVGAPPGESAERPYYQDVQIVRQDGDTVRLAAAVVPPGAPCCQVEHDLIDLRMSDGGLMYRVGSGPWRPAPAAPHRRWPA